MSGSPAAVLIADSQKMFARALALSLEETSEFKVIAENPATGLDTLKILSDPALQCDLVILDYWIGGMTGPATTRAIRRAASPPRVILTGWFHTPLEVNEAFQAGAAAFVSKSAGLSEFMEVLRRVAAGEVYLYGAQAGENIQVWPAPVRNGDHAWDQLMTLTVREIEVLSLLSFAPVEKVAKSLSISMGTLRNHISNILRKMQARSQIEAIDIARRFGLIDT